MIALLMQSTEAVAPTWGALGVGGVLAGMMFYFYRQDRKDVQAQFLAILADHRALIQSNTEAITSLRDLVLDQHREHQQETASRLRAAGGRS